ncbi:MAG: A/G-specific adenine glycosylase [Chloroflexaceae bacterium]|nr:A/G-specific adenine glycosylase [Chloroflexaceae bacterium]
MPPATLQALREALLAWFARNARDLPWRRTRDPYRILVSEIMLQQTQVERVVPKYHAFLEAFPPLERLADAPTAEVIRLWAGLGYNRRAVNLQRTARVVVEEHGGSFPREVAALRRLPGVGPYTAGAVACFAFEQDVAFLDTNIRRVLRRACIGPDELAGGVGDRELLALGAALVPPGRGWAWNQALIELGALVCTAAVPACPRCPLRPACRAYAARAAADEALIGAMAAGVHPLPARRVAERKAQPYAGSRRWYRGRVIDALRALPPGGALPLVELGPRLKPDYASADEPWLRALVADLDRDGLLVVEGERVRLP